MEKEQLNTINKLIRKSFGKGFSGNCILFSNSSGSHMVKADRLESIAKRNWLYIPGIIENHEVIGKFTSEDGSNLDVDFPHRNFGERYAICYALQFKKDASVNGRKFRYESMSWDN